MTTDLQLGQYQDSGFELGPLFLGDHTFFTSFCSSLLYNLPVTVVACGSAGAFSMILPMLSGQAVAAWLGCFPG